MASALISSPVGLPSSVSLVRVWEEGRREG